jgi:ABC-type multidrug transport system ATPase subunit
MIVRRAELWLLDEPHAGLDAAGRDEIDAVLRDAVSAGATVVVSSHELERAGTLASRVVTVDGGMIVDGGRR